MVFGRLTDAVSDLKETLRQVFRDPPSHGLDPALAAVRAKGARPLEAAARVPEYALAVVPVCPRLAFQGAVLAPAMAFQGRLQAEEGWARWAAGAKVCEMPVFSAGAQRRVEVPPLPRRPACQRVAPESYRTACRGLEAHFQRPGVRGGSPELEVPGVRSGLELALGLPIAIQGQDVQTLPKAQWMRFSLQLIKATGENIRNLEVLGLYRIPTRGVASMRHDAKTGRLLLELTRDASGAARQCFLLARRKDDRTLVSCFLEEG
jgi:hypothetical protein